MADFVWEGKTKEMYDKLISNSPKPFQEMTRKRMTESLTKKVGDGGTVTQEILLEIVKEITPKPFLAMAMKSIEPLLQK
ncbi:MAG: hypothetical protein A2042_05790 [Candidatus Schekmanbacteria bacterium GWA2_38_11]|uniref:Uncharacterized protein n=1 Tax=Candidatus Schekmanbacteria bacterium GWA2_38_11 TaxID=1817876 RepID=A0A1F7REN1_9BACT|nr:MAG: hypothetical protein A2042_05790 [Candidatus Schekmanbacteria bacterium GWA2_38_11]